ncbi:MAG: acyl-CoA synthetase FdrA [Spirochaetota bacterium]
MKRVIVRKDSYYDSVFLMLISTDIKKLPGITEAVVAMGTEMNRDLIEGMGLSNPEIAASTANDLIIAVDADDESAVEAAQAKVDELLKKKSGADEQTAYRPGSFAAARKSVPGANLAIISLPGQFAGREARKALSEGMHVMLFSDNVSLDEEVSLKKLAVEKGLLMMGPDCGTAIINGEPICFANVVPRGPIGIVAASGTGLQEVSCAIAHAGSGVSQALGTGGRDIKEEAVGGMMMLQCIEALGADDETKVITVVSKPPKESLTPRVIDALRKTGKPAVVHFVGTDAAPTDGTVHFAGNLTAAARIAVALAGGATPGAGTAHAREAGPATPAPAVLAAGATEPAGDFDLPDSEIDAIVARESARIAASQKYLRGLFVGGTLTDEAVAVLSGPLGGVHSFDAKDPSLKLADPHRSQAHTIVDLGEDVFTVGRPHPMIDPSIRTERLDRESDDAEIAVLLLDCVIGYGSHVDPAGAMLESISRARQKAEERGGYLPVVVSVTGTEGDPQVLTSQQAKLAGAGCVVMPTNYQAARLAQRIMEARA